MTAKWDALLRRLPLLLWGLHLLALPLFPSQDGPSHLHSGRLLVDLLAGREPATAFFEINTGLFTNWASALSLGLFMELGAGPAWAERLWLFVIGVLIVEVFLAIAKPRQQIPIASLLCLILLESRITHLGFFNFLPGTCLALFAYLSWHRDHRNYRCHLLFLLAQVVHPMGGAFFLGLVSCELVLTRDKKRSVSVIPHLLLFLIVTQLNAVEQIRWKPYLLPDFLLSELLPLGDLLTLTGLLLLMAFFVLCTLRAYKREPVEGFGFESRDRLPKDRLLKDTLLLAAIVLFSFSFIGGSLLRPRMVYLACLLLFALLPLRRSRPGSSQLALVLPLLIALCLFNTIRHDHEKAREIDAEFARLPNAEEDATYLLASDGYDSAYLLSSKYEAVEKPTSTPWSIVGQAMTASYYPWLHVMDRWALRGGGLHLYYYQAMHPQFPIQVKHNPRGALTQALDFYPRLLPIADFAPSVERCLLLHLPQNWKKMMLPRIGKSWSIEKEGRDFVLLRSERLLPLTERVGAPSFAPSFKSTANPVYVLKEGEGVSVSAGADFAFLAWRAFLIRADESYLPATDEQITPISGYFDASGSVVLRKVKRPKNTVLCLVLD